MENQFVKTLLVFVLVAFIVYSNPCAAQSDTDTIVLRNVQWDMTSPAKQVELTIPSSGSNLQGFMYKANGARHHPTLLLLHGYPGNERNLDLAQVVRAHGWNVIYFDYRGSWGSQGKFSFKNCVEDVVNLVGYCRQYADSLQIDTSNIVLFGHSMGGWICLKALEMLPGINKGFALSTWDIYRDFKNAKTEEQITEAIKMQEPGYFVLNTPVKEIFAPVLKTPAYYNLANNVKALADKQIIMLDEHHLNKELAAVLQQANHTYFEYGVWQTDHPFTNTRVSMIKKVLAFLDKP